MRGVHVGLTTPLTSRLTFSPDVNPDVRATVSRLSPLDVSGASRRKEDVSARARTRSRTLDLLARADALITHPHSQDHVRRRKAGSPPTTMEHILTQIIVVGETAFMTHAANVKCS